MDSSTNKPRQEWWRVCVLLLALLLPFSAAEGFLSEEIPLEIVTVTPSSLLDGGVITVRYKQTITAVFSRPVIALGADFGEEELPEELIPFKLEPPVPGRLRWVSTYIARFDTQGDWPRDLHVELKWNAELKTYDGVPLQLPSGDTALMKTPSNQMRIADIVSQTANNLTGNNWSAFVGLEYDILPERVFDGVMELRFDVPVSLVVLQKSLKVRRYVTRKKSSEKVETPLIPFIKSCDPERKLSDVGETTCANITIISGRVLDDTRIETSNSTVARDGYGRSLIGTSLNFRTQSVENQFHPVEPKDRLAVFEEGQPWGSRIVLFSKGHRPEDAPFELLASNVGSAEQLAALLFHRFDFEYANRMSDLLTEPEVLTASVDDPAGTVTSYDVEGLLGETRIFAYQKQKRRRSYERISIFVETSLMVSVVTHQTDGGYVGVAFVVDMESGLPVEGVNVSFFRDGRGGWRVRQVGETTVTDKDGLAMVNIWGDDLVAIVEDGPTLMYVDNIIIHKYFERYGEPGRGNVIVDRKLIQPSETLYIKGYVRHVSGTQLELSDSTRAVLQTYPGFDSEDSSKHPVVISPQFGSYEAEIVVPENATLRDYTLRLRCPSTNRDYRVYCGSNSFTVGLPRRPTVELAVEATRWTTPMGEATINVTATSFIGASVGNQDITVKWSLSFYEDGEWVNHDGEEVLITDNTGFAETTIDLSKLEKAPPTGERIDFDVQWVGPTGELIEETAKTQIAWADLEIDIERSVRTDIPLQSFGVWVSLSDLNGRALPKNTPFKTVDIALKSAPEDGGYKDDDTAPLGTPTVASCVYEIETSEPCDFALPSMGVFVLEACTSGDSTTLCQRISLGESELSWKKDPWSEFLPVGIRREGDGSYKIGDEAEIAFENPYQNAHVMILWGNSEKMESTVQALPDSQRSSIYLVLSDLCQFGCWIRLALTVPRQTTGLPVDPPVPVAKLHDPAMPHVVSWDDSLRVEAPTDKTIDIRFDFPDAAVEDGDVVVAPGNEMKMDVELDTETDTEVTVMIVDKAILELISNPLSRPAEAFRIELRVSFDHESSGRYITSPQAMQQLIDDLERKKGINPWLRINDELHADSYYNSDLDISVEEYINRIAQYVTVHPEEGYSYYDYYYAYASASGIALESLYAFAYDYEEAGYTHGAADAEYEAPTATRPVAKISAGEASTTAAASPAPAPGPDDAAEVRVDSDFEPNVLFVTEVTKNGRISLDFDAPVQLGTFVVRAYAATGVDMFGSAETEFVVRREVSVTPSVPRFVRVEDVFMAGVVITVSGTAQTEITLRVETDGPIAVNGPRTQTVNVGEDKQEAARFECTALGMGEASLTFTAFDTDGNRDAIQVSLPIEGLQEGVVVGTSFVLTASDGSATSQEGLDLPLAVPGSGSIVVVAGVGQEPAVLSLVEQLTSRDPEFECPYSSGFVVGLTLIPAIINPYSPWDASDQAELMATVLNRFEEAAELISIGEEKMTRQDRGLLSWLPCREEERWTPGRSVYPNAQALWLMNEVQIELESHPVEEVTKRTLQLYEARDVWRSALEEKCVQEARRARRDRKRVVSIWTVAMCRAGLGADWTPGPDVKEKIRKDLSMERLSKHFDGLSLEVQALYILTRQASDPAHPDVQKAVKSWTGLYRVTGRTAYISAYEGAATPASTLANALILMAMTRAGTEGQLLPKLAAYVAAPVSDIYGFSYFDSYAMAVTMWALVVYDASRNNTQPDIDLSVFSNGFSLLEVTNAMFDEDAPSVVSNTTDWDDLGEKPGPIGFSAVGSGEVSVAITLNFVPLEILPFPSYRGIFVQRSILLEESGDGGSLSVVPQGSTVFVHVQFMTPDSLQETVVRVLMPAGLEPVDPNIAGGGQYCPVPFYSFFRYYEPCPLQQTRPTVVSFEFRSVRAGTQTVSFRAVAVTSGVFTLPPTRVFVRDQPEIMGLSSAGKLEVCDGDCEVVGETVPFQPKTCPECNNGSCNLKEGVCVCFRGFFGEACDQVVTE